MATKSMLRDCCAVRFASRTLPAIVAVLAHCALTTSAPASLIVDSMRYDGRVKQSATVGVEAHATDVDLLPNSAGTLPADNTLPRRLVSGNNLTTTLTEVNDTFNGQPVRHAIITISTSALLFDVFNNTLDPGIALPVTFDAIMYSNSLGAGQFVDVKGVQLDNLGTSGPFSLTPGSVVVSGTGNPGSPLGSLANKLRLQVGISADQVDDYRYGFVKLNIFYGTPQIPEPMSWLMMLVGLAGIGICRKRR